MPRAIENIYVDGKSVYNVERLWSMVSRRKPKRIKTSELSDILTSRVWYKTPQQIIKNKNGSHWNRIQNANMKYPIMLTEDGAVIDGCHRWCKAYLNKQKTIRVHIVKDRDLKKVKMKGNRNG